MKKLIFSLSFLIALTSQAQIGGMLKKAKDKVQQKIENHTDKEIDKALKGEETKAGSPVADSPTTSVTPTHQPIKAYSRYDFVPGELVLYAEDFSQDETGELPLNWNAKGKGMVVTLENQPGKWMRLYPGGKYFNGQSWKGYGENYTLEFDLILDGTTPSGTRFFPTFSFGMFSTVDVSNSEYSLFTQYVDKNLIDITATPNVDAISKIKLLTHANSQNVYDSEKQTLPDYKTSFYKVAHYAIQVQKQRIRFWVNDIKVFDYPRAVDLSAQMDQLFFNVAEYFPYHDNNFGLYISNIKIATGLPDSRHKLIEEGSFSTTGILFDVNSAVIKESSYGVVKEIATVLKENAQVKISIIGHTSNDGNDAANMELSKQRAAAVKELLVSQFAIDASRIETEGKGSSQPVADNKTKEGKMQNRRVEFRKL